MKKISLLEDYGINDASNEEKIVEMLDKIDIQADTKVDLNLRHCIIDYPATSKLIDKILFQLKKLNGKKELHITVSYVLTEQTLLNALLGDSKFFKIEAKREIPIKELRKQINTCIKPVNIILGVEIIDRQNKSIVKYLYGIK